MDQAFSFSGRRPVHVPGRDNLPSKTLYLYSLHYFSHENNVSPTQFDTDTNYGVFLFFAFVGFFARWEIRQRSGDAQKNPKNKTHFSQTTTQDLFLSVHCITYVIPNRLSISYVNQDSKLYSICACQLIFLFLFHQDIYVAEVMVESNVTLTSESILASWSPSVSLSVGGNTVLISSSELVAGILSEQQLHVVPAWSQWTDGSLLNYWFGKVVCLEWKTVFCFLIWSLLKMQTKTC